MATLTLKTDFLAFITLNGNFIGKIDHDCDITIPFPSSETLFCAIPADSAYKQLNYSIINGKLLPCSGRLCKWSEDIYELFFVFEKERSLPPPVILKQDTWRESSIGLCGGYFVTEEKNVYNYFPEPIDDYLILSNEYVVLLKEQTVKVINRNMEEVFKRDNCIDYHVSKNALTVLFTAGDMDFFTIEQIFDKKLVSSKIIKADCNTAFDRLRCFCQSLRLDVDVSEFITPQLKEQMGIESIKNFLGVFDQTDSCRYLSKQTDNAVALRYMVDPYNFHYCSFEFKFRDNLIDDIIEL